MSLLILDNINNTCTICGTFVYTLICTCTLYCIKFENTVAGTKENKRYNFKNCDLVNEKTRDV